MSIKISELVSRLAELPGDWKAEATRSGGSIQVWDEDGVEYGFVFTGHRPTRILTDRRRARDRAGMTTEE